MSCSFSEDDSEWVSHFDSNPPGDERPPSPASSDDFSTPHDQESLLRSDVMEIFGMTHKIGPFFPVSRTHAMPVPDELEYELSKLKTCSSRLGVLLKHCLRDEKALRSWVDPPEPAEPLHHLIFTRGSRLQITVKHRDKIKEVSGEVDYFIWYDGDRMSSGVVFAGAEDYSDLGMAKFRCLIYMGITLRIRKQSPAIIYGVATDGFDFEFLSLDSTGRLNQWRPCNSWNTHTKNAIYTICCLAIRQPEEAPRIPYLEFEGISSTESYGRISSVKDALSSVFID